MLKTTAQGDRKESPPPKPPSRGEGLDDQNEEADDTGLYDRDEDMYNQDAEVLDNLGEDDD
jgi:hypothetical protein